MATQKITKQDAINAIIDIFKLKENLVMMALLTCTVLME